MQHVQGKLTRVGRVDEHIGKGLCQSFVWYTGCLGVKCCFQKL